MASANCMRYLVRPSQAVLSIPARRAAPSTIFSTQFSVSAVDSSRRPPVARTKAPAKGDRPGPTGHVRAGKKITLGKFKKVRTAEKGKSPLPGERKAIRKRIILSNSNALLVPGLQELSANAMLDPARTGSVVSIPDQVVDQLRAIEAFKPSQCWGFFRHPSTLIRKESTELCQRLQKSAEEGKTLKLVITGDRLTGKSILLMQAIAHAYLNNWIVFNIPEAQELTTAVTEYAPIPQTKPAQYMQHAYALKMIQALRKANQKLLTELKTVNPHPNLVQHFPVGTPLMQIANSAKEADTTWPIFNALWQELTAPNVSRPPILFALDGLAHIMKVSAYRSPAFELVHSHDLAIIRRFVDYLSGATTLPNGGAVVAATTRGNSPRSPSMELELARREAEQMSVLTGRDVPAPTKEPYRKDYDDRVEASLKNVQVTKLKGVSKPEARAIMEYWAASGVLRSRVDEKTVSEKWTIGGNGILGEIERVSLLTPRL